MKAKDFNFTNNTVRFVRGFSAEELQESTKTHETQGNADALPIHLDMLERLRKLCMAKNPDDFLFTDKKGKALTQSAFGWKFQKAATAAGMPNVEPYRALKHASLSSMASESGDLYNTSKMARHTTTAMTEKYTRRLNLKAIGKVQMTLRIPDNLIPKN
jgi:site-specific recombinase XerC